MNMKEMPFAIEYVKPMMAMAIKAHQTSTKSSQLIRRTPSRLHTPTKTSAQVVAASGEEARARHDAREARARAGLDACGVGGERCGGWGVGVGGVVGVGKGLGAELRYRPLTRVRLDVARDAVASDDGAQHEAEAVDHHGAVDELHAAALLGARALGPQQLGARHGADERAEGIEELDEEEGENRLPELRGA